MTILLDEFGNPNIDYLTSDDVYKANRIAAEKKAAEFTSEHWKAMRKLAKKDLFWLCYSVLNYNRLTPAFHGDMCVEVNKTEQLRFREWLSFRGSFKSTILTIGHSIQCALPDDSSDSPWPLCLGTDIRLLICHETHESAQRYLASITGHFLGNEFLMALFPECVPNPRKHRINKSELELPRKSIWNEPTFDTLGVGGRAQGRHYNKLKLDDLIGDKARDSKTEMKSAIEWFDNIQSLFSTFAKDSFDLIGTRWSFDDLYAHAHSTYGTNLHSYIRKVEEPVKVLQPDGTHKTVKQVTFPEEFPQDSLAILRKNKKVWNAQYLNDPFEGEGGFKDEWLQYYYYKDKTTLIYFTGLAKDKQEVSLSELNKYILIDPAMSGLWGFMVIGVDHKGRIFILEALKDDKDPPFVVDLMFKKVIQYQPKCVAIEKVLFSGLFQHWLVTEMSVRKIRFKVEQLTTRGVEKEARILGLSNYFSSLQVFCNEGHLDFLEEYQRFGFTSNIHLLDAFAQAPKVIKPFVKLNLIGESSSGNQDKRDPTTGYSKIVMGKPSYGGFRR